MELDGFEPTTSCLQSRAGLCAKSLFYKALDFLAFGEVSVVVRVTGLERLSIASRRWVGLSLA